MTEHENNTAQQRIFKIGSNTIVADGDLAEMDNEQAREFFKHSFPEVANATIRETTLDDGSVAVHFLPRAGRKG